MAPQVTHDPTHSVASAAAVVGVSASQIRNWAAQFADHLSPLANPGPGQPRQLTQSDLAILQAVKELRAHGVAYDDIPAQLPDQAASLTPYIEIQTIPTAQNALESRIDANQVALLVESRFQGIQAQIEQLSRAQAAQERQQVSKITTFAAGLIVGMVLVFLVVGIFALASYVGN